MARRAIPSSLQWLILLIGAALMISIAAGAYEYLQGRHTARLRAESLSGGNEGAGKSALVQYGCGSCHIIPGVPGADGQVGPDLTHLGLRAQIGGRLANDPSNLINWLQDPQKVSPGCGMPKQPMPLRKARDISAYLYSQK